MAQKTKIGIIGCGAISNKYLKNAPRFGNIFFSAVADLDHSRAVSQAEKFTVPRALSVEELVADEEIEIILNLTIPAAHGELALKALAAGKSVYNEKPLALDRAEALAMLQTARDRGLRIGCAPDTFLGAGLQTCRRLIDSGVIGTPVAAAAAMLSPGVEAWHPNPSFYYQPGGGPMFDMGPYYLTALTALLGPVRRVSASARISFEKRTITSEPLRGQMIDVRVPTHISGIMDFASGVVGTITTSFDIAGGSHQPNLEIYGTEGTLQAPDPNTFGGPIRISRGRREPWQEIPLEFSCAEESRGLGLAEMAAAIRAGRPHRANESLAFHVLDLMRAFHDSSLTNRHVELESTMTRPEPLPPVAPTGQSSGLPDAPVF